MSSVSLISRPEQQVKAILEVRRMRVVHVLELASTCPDAMNGCAYTWSDRCGENVQFTRIVSERAS